MSVFHVGDSVEIHCEDHEYALYGIRGEDCSKQGVVVRVSQADNEDWLKHRVKLTSGREVSVPHDKLFLRELV